MCFALNNLALDIKSRTELLMLTNPAKANPEGVMPAPFMSHNILTHVKIRSLFSSKH